MWRAKHSYGVIAMGITGFVTAVALLAMFVVDRDLTSPNNVLLRVQAERLSPVVDHNDDVECDAFSSVEFTYRVYNNGSATITGLNLALSCSCQIVELPDTIAAGQNALITFRVTAPHAGRIQRQIPLYCNQQETPVLALNASLRVKIDPPSLMRHSGGRQVTFLTGQGESREIVFEALEEKKAVPWICGIRSQLHDAIEVQPMRVVELPEGDPDLTRRRYHFPVANRSLDVGRHTSTIQILTTEGMPKITDLTPFVVEVIDSVAVVPNVVVFPVKAGNNNSSRKLTAICRDSGRLSVKPAFDHKLLDVKEARPKTDSIATFEISRVAGSELPDETEVVFDFGERGIRSVKVLFESEP